MVHSHSPQITNFVKEFEQIHDGDLHQIGLQPKPDPVGNWTEGYGHLMLDEQGRKLNVRQYPSIASVLKYSTIRTVAEALDQLDEDLRHTAIYVNVRLKVKVTQYQFDALVSHAYNCGFSETLYRLINTRSSLKDIKNWFTTKYITADGVFLLGLQYRRNDEYEIFIGKNYKREYKRSI